MPEKRTDTADISFVIKAVIYWLFTAIPALLLASAALSLTNADGAKFAYASAAVSFCRRSHHHLADSLQTTNKA